MKKNAVSLMLSYVLLIIIGLSLAIGVYVWMKKYANVEETPKCPEDVSLLIQDYSCNSTTKTINLSIKNKGLFNMDGYDINGVNDTKKEPLFPLKDSESPISENGRYFFGVLEKKSLKPDKIDSHTFSYDVAGIKTDLKKIGIEPFRVQDDYVILCGNAKIIQEVSCLP